MNNQKKIFFMVLTTVILTGLFFSVYAFSKIGTIRMLRASVNSIDTEIEAKKGRITDRSTETKKGIPPQMWVAEFIELSFGAAQKLGIRDLTFEQKTGERSAALQPRRAAQNGSAVHQAIRSYPVKLSFHSGYREMAEFIRALQALDRLVTIDNLKIRVDKNTLAVEMTANTYSMETK